MIAAADFQAVDETELDLAEDLACLWNGELDDEVTEDQLLDWYAD